MLENIAQKKVSERNHRRWLPITSLALASISSAVFCLPSNSAETVVQRKVFMTGDGVTETTTTTTTERVTPGTIVGERVVVPAAVDRVIVPAPVSVAADTVVVPAVPSTTVVKEVITPATPVTTVEKVIVPGAVNKVVIDANVYKSQLQSRQNRLRAVIAANIANGTLTAEQAARYRAELDRLASIEASLDSSKQLTYERVLPLAYEYDLISSNLKVVDLQPIVQGSKFVLSESHVYAIDDLMARRAGLEAKISMQLVNGKLTQAEADRLRGMLNHVATIESQYRADGEITDREAKNLYGEFDKVGSAIDKAL